MTQKYYRDPMDDDLWDPITGEYIGLPADQCEDKGEKFGETREIVYKGAKGGSDVEQSKRIWKDDFSGPPPSVKPAHESSVGKAMADQYTPKPKPQYSGGGYGGPYGAGGGGYGGYRNPYGGGYGGGSYGSQSANKYGERQAVKACARPRAEAHARTLALLLESYRPKGNVSAPIGDVAPESIDIITETIVGDLTDLLDASECIVWGSNAGRDFRELMKAWVKDNIRLLPNDDGDDEKADGFNDELPLNMK